MSNISRKKKIADIVKLQVPAGKANPAPPIGTALGPRGINIMDFCKSFNEKTKNMEVGAPIPVVITIFSDKSFSFEMKSPPNTYYIKKYLGISKGHTSPGKGDIIGKLNMSQVKEIAEQKLKDTNANDLDGAIAMIIGSARSMGVEVGDK